MSKLINSALNGDPISFRDEIVDALSNKVTDAIDAKKIEMAQTFVPSIDEEDIEEEIDDDFESAYDYSDEEEDDSEIVNAIDDLPGAGSMKGANLPTDAYETTGDELSDMEYREVDSVPPAYVRGENGVYTHNTNEAVELDELQAKKLIEDHEQIDENVFHCLERVAGTNRGSKYRFDDGSVANISVDAATKMLQTYGSLNPKNQGRFAQMAQESKDGFNRLSEFAFNYKQGH